MSNYTNYEDYLGIWKSAGISGDRLSELRSMTAEECAAVLRASNTWDPNGDLGEAIQLCDLAGMLEEYEEFGETPEVIF
jgi:hypothetical protein